MAENIIFIGNKIANLTCRWNPVPISRDVKCRKMVCSKQKAATMDKKPKVLFLLEDAKPIVTEKELLRENLFRKKTNQEELTQSDRHQSDEKIVNFTEQMFVKCVKT